MRVSLAALLAPETAASIKSTLLSLLRSQGFPVDSWGAFSVPRALVEMLSAALPDVIARIQNVVRLGFLETSEGGWLRFLATHFYEVDYQPATAAIGGISLGTAPSAGPYTLRAGDLVVAAPNGLLFRNRDALVLSPSTIVAGVAFVAESPGTDYNNIPAGSTFTLATSLPGVTAANPILGVTGTWLLVPGTDDESDDRLRERCRQKWSTLGTGANDDAYAYWAKTASAAITRVLVQPTTPDPGTVTIIVAGPTGPAPPDVVNAAQTLIGRKRPCCVDAFVKSASADSVPIVGAITVKSAQLSAAQTAVQSALDRYQSSLEIGDVVRAARIIGLMMDQDGVVDVALDAPTTNIALPATSIAVLAPRSFRWITI